MTVRDTQSAALQLPPKRVTLFCDECEHIYTSHATRCERGAMVETRYEPLGPWDGRQGGFFERFWPVLPVRSAENIGGDIDLRSPTVRADALRAVIGGPELWIKDETALPTSTTKARVGILVFPYLRELGVREFVVSSTGNTSTAVAWMARYFPDMTVHIFIGRDFASRLDFVTSPNVITHLVNANFVETGKVATQIARERGLFWEDGFFNPARRDGLKTAYIEAALDIGQPPATYVQAVSSAMGVVGVAKGAAELETFGLPASLPRLICVQQQSCAPMVSAWEADSPVIRPQDRVDQPEGIAEAILRGDPTGAYPIVRRLVQASNGTVLGVSNEEIRHAQALLLTHLGIAACEAGACGLAGYIKAVEQGRVQASDGPTLINVTGGRRVL